MAEPISAAAAAAPVPDSADIARAEEFVRERFMAQGEQPAEALAPGSVRRRALDQALAELDADPKAKGPSTAWRREFSLLLGLERLLSEDEPKLADGTVLSAHQVDALSGTLTALLAAAQSAAPNGNGRVWWAFTTLFTILISICGAVVALVAAGCSSSSKALQREVRGTPRSSTRRATRPSPSPLAAPSRTH